MEQCIHKSKVITIKRRTKKIKKFLRIMILIMFLVPILFGGRFLLVSQRPIKSDVIIVLGGGDGERELKASKLYKNGYAKFVMLSNGGSRNNISTKKAKKEIEWLASYGVPENAIIQELSALSTYDNAVNTKKLMEENKFKSAIVVSSSYHMRRSKFIFDKVYANSGIKLNYQYAPVENYNPYIWWATPSGWQYTAKEYVKFAGYYLIYGLIREIE